MGKYLGFVAVLVFLFSCAEIERDNPYDKYALNYIEDISKEGSSSSVAPSSGSVVPSSSSAPPSSSSIAQSSSSGTSSALLCEGEKYDPDVFRCEFGELVGKCAGIDFYPAYQICDGGVIKNKNEPSSSSSMPSSSSSNSSSSSSSISSSSLAYSSSNSSSSQNSGASSSSQQQQGGGGVVYGTVTYEGQTYKTVVIGTQTWMAENLNYAASGSKCGDGSSLSDDNTTTCDTYGRLYNWNTATTVCPSGWHLPSDAEWTTLTDYVGSTAGLKLKNASGWNSNNGTDQYGFSALPGGLGYSSGTFSSVGNRGLWWSATASDASIAYQRSMDHNTSSVGRNNTSKGFLYSVRCVKD